MKYSSMKQAALAANERREMLIRSVRTYVLGSLIQRGFEVAPLTRRGPIDRELVLSLPLGRLIRSRKAAVDLVELDFAPYRRPAFRIIAGVAPKEGMMTYTGHWAAEDVYVGWLNEFYGMFASPRWQVRFRVWRWPSHFPTQTDYDNLAQRVTGFLPELELALLEGRLGPHMRRFVIPRPEIRVTEGTPGPSVGIAR